MDNIGSRIESDLVDMNRFNRLIVNNMGELVAESRRGVISLVIPGTITHQRSLIKSPLPNMVNLRQFVVAALGAVVAVLSVLVWFQHRQIESWKELMGKVTETAGRQEVTPWNDSVRSDFTAGLLPAVGEAEQATESLDRNMQSISTLMQDPLFIRALVSHQRTLLDNRFAEVFRDLSLTPQELERIRSLLIEKQNSALDVLMLSRSDIDLSVASAEVNMAAEMARAEVDAAIEITLGPERYSMFKRFEETLPQRATVEQLAQRLSYSDSPLRSEQAEALVDLMVEVGGTVKDAMPGVSLVVNPETQQAVPIVHGMEKSSQITDELIVRAQAVLEPQQVLAFRQLRQEQGAAEMVVNLARGYMGTNLNNQEVDPIPGLDVQLLLQ